MPGLNIRPGAKISKTSFDTFAVDLELFLQAFPPAPLAKWMEKNPGKLHKKLNGTHPITDHDMIVFYRTVGPVVSKLKDGLTPLAIELEMKAVDENRKNFEKGNIWEAIRLIKEILEKQGRVIEHLMVNLEASKNEQKS